MVKPDIKVNYYAALELPPDATVDDVKKQYRKLALRYHPDRNPGKEDECNPKFQAISAAHEVLGDQASKTKYDNDRRRANVSAAAAPRPPAAGQRGNPYAAAGTTQWAAPPRRTQDPTGWTARQRPAPATGGAGDGGAYKFTNFPRPAPTARTPTTEKSTASEAWNQFGPGKAPTSRPAPAVPPRQGRTVPPRPQQQPAAPPTQPAPPPRREEEIRAGMNYRPAPTAFNTTAYAHFNAASPSTPQPPPGVQRANTARSTGRSGFDPNAPGADEPATHAPSAYSHRYKDPETPFAYETASQPSQQPQSYFTPAANGSSQPRPTSNVPPGLDRTPSTYHQSGGEKIFFSSDQLRRSQSTRATSELFEEKRSSPAANGRHRSASPAKSKSAQDRTKQAHFDIPDNSDDSTSDSASSTTSHPSKPQQTPRERHIKIPTSRLNGARFPDSGTPAKDSNSPRVSTADETAASANNMYDDFAFLFAPNHDQHKKEEVWCNVFPFGPQPASDVKRGSVPNWAIPSSIVPRPSDKQGDHSTDFQQDGSIWVADPPLIDVEIDSAHTGFTMHSTANSKNSHERDMQQLSDLFRNAGTSTHESHPGHLADNASSFTVPFTVGSGPGQAGKGRAEQIDTDFSSRTQAPTFTGSPAQAASSPLPSRRSSPSRRGREPVSARTSRNPLDKRSASDLQTPPTEPGAGSGVYDGASAAQPAKPASGTFSPDQWADHTFFASPFATPATEAPPTSGQPQNDAQAAEQMTEQGASGFAADTSAADAMDIDSTPAAQPAPPTQPSWTGASTAPATAVPHSRQPSTTTLPSLHPLSSTLDAPTGQGLADLSALHSSIPFETKASTAHPSTLLSDPVEPSLPPLRIPEAPAPPQRLTRSSWKLYATKTIAYLDAHHKLHRDLAALDAAALTAQQRLLQGGPAALEAQGAGGAGVEAYARRCRADVARRELACVAAERHAGAVEEFVRVKARVRELVGRGALVDGP